MNLCGDCEIVYDEKNCPLCEAKAEIRRLEKELEVANNSI